MGMDDSKEDLEVKVNLGAAKKIKVEWILIILFIFFLLKFVAVFDGGLIIHDDGPYNFAAGDMFVFTAFADVAKFEDDMSKQPSYLAAGKTDGVNFFSMLGGIIAAQLADFIGAESHDFIVHLNLFLIIVSIFIIFQFLTKIDLRLAILSLPLSLLVFKWPFQYTITWGMHIANVNILFVVVSLLCIYYLDKKYIWIVLGIMNGAGVLAHAREMLMFNLGVALYFLIRLLKEKIPQGLIKNPASIKNYLKENKTVISLKHYIFSIPITLIMMFRQLPVLSVFKGSASVGDSGGLSSIIQYVAPKSFHHVFFPQFGFYKYLIFIGAAIALYFLIFKKTRIIDIIASFTLIFLFSGFFSILGNKTTQIRHLFPVLLIPLVGLVLYMIYNSIKKSTKTGSNILFIILFLSILIPTATSHAPGPVSDYAFSDPFTWDAFEWIHKNVPDDAQVLTLYGDRHTQLTMFAMMRKPYFTTVRQDYLDKIAKATLTSQHTTQWGFIHFYMRQSKFTQLELVPRPLSLIRTVKSLCDFDYIYSDKVSQNPQIHAYTLLVLNKLITENEFIMVYQNDLVVVLKNNNVGGKCFEDEALT